MRKARDSLVAQSQYPSVDAVRIALGNTGSKTTIHKYLKELEEEEGGSGGQKASVSEALQDLVERLAARLAQEADVRIEQVTQEFSTKELAHAQTLQRLENELLAAREAARSVEVRLQSEIAGHAKTHANLQTETVARRTAVQQVADLKDRLEQAQLELRQQQLAVRGKQDEVAKLNQEGARLVLELSHTKQSLYEQLTNGRKLEQKIEQLQSAHLHTGDLQRQLVSKIAEVELLSEQLKAAEAQLEPAKARAREFELLLAQANAKVQAQDQIGEQLQAYLDKMTTGQGQR
ncbi:DNA-binding protein [Burkholderia sp. LMU1-1-1.1]|uniref:DNA-binding protein n=1 Tax=Burkholderia sp. LMU1-1-1.1 TaxID=3135266 RepID=UPI00343A5385